MTDADLALKWLLGRAGDGRAEGLALVRLFRAGLCPREIRDAAANALHGQNGPRLIILRAANRPIISDRTGNEIFDFISGSVVETKNIFAHGRYELRDLMRSNEDIPQDILNLLAVSVESQKLSIDIRRHSRGRPSRPVRHDIEAADSKNKGASAKTETVELAGRKRSVSTLRRRRRLLKN